ncbi:MAG: GNAT family N-acetyltransferase [Geitlerinemataceae cyanobacterium]
MRNDILRKPLGLEISSKQLQNEKNENYNHFVAVDNNIVISALSVCTRQNYNQLCQIATAKRYRRKGIGKNLVLYAEKLLSRIDNLKVFLVFSRINSIGFYQNCGYDIVDSEIYELVGLEHRKMSKILLNT